MSSSVHDVAIIGAGPFGLAAAAYLRAAGIETIIFGKSMEFWDRHMPAGMWLRSTWDASHISDPRRALTLDAYEAAQNIRLEEPIPKEDFVKYGQWFQHQAAPDVDPRRVTRLERSSDGFRVQVEDGETLLARRLVVATGIAPFAYRPPQFDVLPQLLASHSSDHCDLEPFKGKQVIVVGGGQSAIECAALLHETGAEVEILLHRDKIHWLGGDSLHNLPKWVRYAFYPPSDVGPPIINWIVNFPAMFRLFPPGLRQRMDRRCIVPSATNWLRRRTEGIQITPSRQVISAKPENGRLCLTLDDGNVRRVDHVLLATGYRVDIAQLDFLASELLERVDRIDGFPRLGFALESSVPGLFFVGATAAKSFGPLMRFVSGSGYAGRMLTRRILQGSPGQAGQHGSN